MGSCGGGYGRVGVDFFYVVVGVSLSSGVKNGGCMMGGRVCVKC